VIEAVSERYRGLSDDNQDARPERPYPAARRRGVGATRCSSEPSLQAVPRGASQVSIVLETADEDPRGDLDPGRVSSFFPCLSTWPASWKKENQSWSSVP